MSGRTGRRGSLFVPDLRSYLSSPIGIVQDDLPVDVNLGATSQDIAVPYRGGAVVTFEAEVIHALSGRLDVAGSAPKYGTLNGHRWRHRIQLAAERHRRVLFRGSAAWRPSWRGQLGSHTCRATIHMPDKAQPMTDAGVVNCAEGGKVTPARSLTVALLALAVLIGARPGAEAQFPHGLLAGAGSKGRRSCTIETRPLSFGNYDPEANAAVDAVAQVIYTCNNQAKKIRIDMAQGTSNSFDRSMSNGGYNLDYNIYLDSTHRTVWGDGVLGTDVYYENNPPNGTPVVVPAYGRIPARQDPEPGQYVDSVTVRVLF